MELLPADLLLELTARHLEPHRRYHDLRHVADLLVRGRDLGLSREQAMAIWFHDAIYDVPPDRNEERSAALCLHRLTTAGYDLTICERVAQMVRDTETHVPTIPESDLVVDLDLSPLADPWPIFAANSRLLREEQPMVSDADWERGTREFLIGLRDRDRIFVTDWGAGLEGAARANIGRALSGAG